MAWMLQPHNMIQAIRPNYYRVAYRRTGAYKGMGQTDAVAFPWADGTASDGSAVTVPFPQGSAVPCMATGSQGPLSPGQTWCATGTGAAPAYPYGTDPTTATVSSWLQANSGMLVIGAAVVLVVLMAGRR